jgi:hypothetical protein
MGACGSSKSSSTPDSGTPATSDSGINKPDVTVIVADGGGDTGGTKPGADALGDSGAVSADTGIKLDADTTVVVDAPVDGVAPDAGTPGVDAPSDTPAAKPDTAVDTKPISPDTATPDTATPDTATPDTNSKPVYDGGLAGSCIKALFGTYVLRWDGILIDETTPTSPQTVFEASSGLPLAGVVSAQQGPSHGCALLSNGTVQCWQNQYTTGNFAGQLGNGTITAATTHYRATPVLTAAASPLANVVAFATGLQANSACAITGDGKLWCWGDLSWLVNKGTALSTGYAQAITKDGDAPLTGVISATMGTRQACALVAGTSNSAWCWGVNNSGEVGQGDTNPRQYPTKVLGLANPSAIALAGSGYQGEFATVCALDGAGVKCWGQNSGGMAGVNVDTNEIFSPTAVVVESGAALEGATAIFAGSAMFAVLRSSGTIWHWGYGLEKYAANYGQTNVIAVGWPGPTGNNGPRFLTSDGVYHNDTVPVTVNCNAL